MIRFVVAWESFWNAWDHWTPEKPVAEVFWVKKGLSDEQVKTVWRILDGKAYAQSYRAKKTPLFEGKEDRT